MKKVVEQIKEELIKRCKSDNNKCGFGAWTHHISTVVDIAKKLAVAYNADVEIVELAALLHDIASVTDESMLEEHHLHGARIAEELLTKLSYPKERIERIKECIIVHRGSKVMAKNTIEAICLADADALAHFYNIPSLFSLVYKEKGMSIDDGANFIKNKLERSYNKLSKNTKEKFEPAYIKIMSIFNQNNEYFDLNKETITKKA